MGELRVTEGTSASFGKSSLKLAREVANTPKVIALANTSCCFATSGTNTLGSKSSRRRDVIKWHLFPRLQCHAITSSWPSNVFRNDLKHNMKLSLSMFSQKQKVSCYLKVAACLLTGILSLQMQITYISFLFCCRGYEAAILIAFH